MTDSFIFNLIDAYIKLNDDLIAILKGVSMTSAVSKPLMSFMPITLFKKPSIGSILDLKRRRHFSLF